MLVGNKRDLAHIREVTVEEGTALAEQHKYVIYRDISTGICECDQCLPDST
jgi:hypothetical protein